MYNKAYFDLKAAKKKICFSVQGVSQFGEYAKTFLKSRLVRVMFWKFACSNVRAGSALVASTATQ